MVVLVHSYIWCDHSHFRVVPKTPRYGKPVKARVGKRSCGVGNDMIVLCFAGKEDQQPKALGPSA